jgi:hypothetical protein
MTGAAAGMSMTRHAPAGKVVRLLRILSMIFISVPFLPSTTGYAC